MIPLFLFTSSEIPLWCDRSTSRVYCMYIPRRPPMIQQSIVEKCLTGLSERPANDHGRCGFLVHTSVLCRGSNCKGRFDVCIWWVRQDLLSYLSYVLYCTSQISMYCHLPRSSCVHPYLECSIVNVVVPQPALSGLGKFQAEKRHPWDRGREVSAFSMFLRTGSSGVWAK